jgi:cysteinyl-tRNA synthetase
LQHEAQQNSPAHGSFTAGAANLSEDDINAQIEARKAAKAARDFAAADAIRDALKAQGIELIDQAGGLTEWLRN